MIQVFFLGGFDGAGRINLILMTCAVIFNFRAFLRSPRYMLVWGVWVVYVIICSKIKGFYTEVSTFSIWCNKALFLPFVSMQVAYQAVKYDHVKTLKYIFYAYVFFVVIGTLRLGASETNSDRQTNDMGNYFFNNAILLATYASAFFSFDKIKKIVYYSLLALVLYTIYISGERKGLICVFIIVIGSLYARNYGKGIKTFLYVGVLTTVAYLAINFAMMHSVAGARMEESLEESSFQDNLFLKLMGDRGIMYYEGWEMFLNNMWTGIGITNFCWENSFFYGLPLHTEYMVQLTECGICGSTLYLLFNLCIIKKLIDFFLMSKDKTIAIIFISTMLAILIISFVAWIYSCSGYFIVYGLIFGLHKLSYISANKI